MSDDQKQVLFENTARNMGNLTFQIKHIYNCYQAGSGREIDTNTNDYIELETDHGYYKKEIR